jgi:hypothetical protein
VLVVSKKKLSVSEAISAAIEAKRVPSAKELRPWAAELGIPIDLPERRGPNAHLCRAAWTQILTHEGLLPQVEVEVEEDEYGTYNLTTVHPSEADAETEMAPDAAPPVEAPAPKAPKATPPTVQEAVEAAVKANRTPSSKELRAWAVELGVSIDLPEKKGRPSTQLVNAAWAEIQEFVAEPTTREQMADAALARMQEECEPPAACQTHGACQTHREGQLYPVAPVSVPTPVSLETACAMVLADLAVCPAEQARQTLNKLAAATGLDFFVEEDDMEASADHLRYWYKQQLRRWADKDAKAARLAAEIFVEELQNVLDASSTNWDED